MKKVELYIFHTNHNPIITSDPIILAYEDHQYKYQLHAFDQDTRLFGDQIVYSATTKPEWLSIDSISGILRGVPTRIEQNSINVLLEAKDNKVRIRYQNFNLEISPTKYFIFQNYPNPFRNYTYFKYKLPFDSNVKFSYNISGNQKYQNNEIELTLPSGIYLCRFEAIQIANNNFTFSKTFKIIISN